MNAPGLERLQEQLRTLVAQRQALREGDANRDELELARRERQLSRALSDLHLCHAPDSLRGQKRQNSQTSHTFPSAGFDD